MRSLTAPAGATAGPAVVFINNGFGSHVGPSRLWVDLARAWARHGVATWRLDLSGICDSPARPGLPDHVVYSPAAFDDLRDVAQALDPGDPSNVVWVGLCSGAYQALEATVALRARGACVVNPVLRFAPPEALVGPLDPRRRIARPKTNVSRLARRLPDLPLISRQRMEALRELGRPSAGRSAGSWLDDLRAAGRACGTSAARTRRGRCA